MKHFCEQACRLGSDHYERPLTFYERVRLRLHLWVCRACRNYLNALDTLHQTMRHLQDFEIGRYRLSESQREKISQFLQKS